MTTLHIYALSAAYGTMVTSRQFYISFAKNMPGTASAAPAGLVRDLEALGWGVHPGASVESKIIVSLRLGSTHWICIGYALDLHLDLHLDLQASWGVLLGRLAQFRF